jgi:hypothetical protein
MKDPWQVNCVGPGRGDDLKSGVHAFDATEKALLGEQAVVNGPVKAIA